MIPHFEAAEHLYLEPEEELFSTYPVKDVLRAFELVSKDEHIRREFTDMTHDEPLLNIGKIVQLFKMQQKLSNILGHIDWHDVHHCLYVLCATGIGRNMASDLWKQNVPSTIGFPAPSIDPGQTTKMKRVIQPPRKQGKSRKR